MSLLTEQYGPGAAPVRPERLRFDLPSAGPRRPRTSWVAGGILVLVVFGLLGAVTVARVADREPVLALSQPVERGQVLTAAHLKVVEVGTDGDVSLVSASDAQALVGLTALAPLAADTLVSPTQFADGPALPAGYSVVGLALGAGEYPTAALRPGDRVVVVATTPSTVTGDPNAMDRAEVLVQRAEVFDVAVLSEATGTLAVSVVVPEALAPQVAAAAAAGRIRLALVGER